MSLLLLGHQCYDSGSLFPITFQPYYVCLCIDKVYGAKYCSETGSSRSIFHFLLLYKDVAFTSPLEPSVSPQPSHCNSLMSYFLFAPFRGCVSWTAAGQEGQLVDWILTGNLAGYKRAAGSVPSPKYSKLVSLNWVLIGCLHLFPFNLPRLCIFLQEVLIGVLIPVFSHT